MRLFRILSERKNFPPCFLQRSVFYEACCLAYRLRGGLRSPCPYFRLWLCPAAARHRRAGRCQLCRFCAHGRQRQAPIRPRCAERWPFAGAVLRRSFREQHHHPVRQHPAASGCPQRKRLAGGGQCHRHRRLLAAQLVRPHRPRRAPHRLVRQDRHRSDVL